MKIPLCCADSRREDSTTSGQATINYRQTRARTPAAEQKIIYSGYMMNLYKNIDSIHLNLKAIKAFDHVPDFNNIETNYNRFN